MENLNLFKNGIFTAKNSSIFQRETLPSIWDFTGQQEFLRAKYE